MFTYTVPEAAERLKVSTRTVWRWIRAGRLNATKLVPGKGGTVRVTEAEIERFLDGGATPRPAA